MLFRSTASKPMALAAAFALAMSSTAFAQTMVGDQEVAADDMPLVEEHCASLASVDEMEAMETDDTTADATTGAMAPDAGAAGGMDAGAPGADAMAAPDATDTAEADMDAGDDDAGIVDLAAITAEDCETAGIATQ